MMESAHFNGQERPLHGQEACTPLTERVAAALGALLSQQLSRSERERTAAPGQGGRAELQVVLDALCRQPDVAVRLVEAGRHVPDIQFGPIGPILMAQRTARAAIEMASFCHASIGGRAWSLETMGSLVHFGTRTQNLNLREHPLLWLAVSVVYHAGMRFWGLGAAGKLSAELPFAEPAPELAAQIRQIFAGNVRFAAGRAGLCFPAALLDAERYGADAEFTTRLRDYALSHNLGRSEASSWVSRVESVLKAARAGDKPQLQRAARELRVSTRTLRRRLTEEGTTFTDVAARVRQERALQLLLETDLPLQEIGRVLGYADPNSFRRAIQTAFGRSPLRIRQSGLPR